MNQLIDRKRWWTEILLLCLLALFWGSSYLWIKLGLIGFGPVTLIAFRVSIAAVVLLVVLFASGYSLPTDMRTWGLLAVQSFMNSFGAWTLLAWGQQFVDSGLAGVLNSMSPVFVFFITVFITRHESVGLRKFIGALLGVTGILFIMGPGVLAGLGQQVLAQLSILAGSFLYGCAAIFGKRFSGLPPAVTAASAMLIASVVMWPAAFVFEDPLLMRPDIKSIGAILMLSVFGTAGALLLYFRLVNTLGSMGVASQGFLRIGVSVLLGVIVLGETLTPMIILGLIACLFGVALINFPARAKQP
ncbi:MAG: DMT family transporter [Burkholderiaceae bacterium]